MTGSMTGAMLQTTGLSRQFGGVHAVRNVDLRVDPGELRCLIGPNGAGKSTFFKMLTGQLRPSQGSVQYRGREIGHMQPHAIARLGVGIKMQVPSVFDGLTAHENIHLAASRHHRGRAADAATARQIERLRLGDLAKRLVGQLAHGQRQLVELGAVLAGDPALILLDEPAAGMTQDETDRLAVLIREINADHTLIVVEHDMEFVRSIARRVTVFNQGAVLAEGSVDAVLRDHRVIDVYLGRQVAA